MTKTFKSPFKNSKLKAFFFFLLLTTLFWVLTKFSNNFIAPIVAKINYTNIPNTTLLTENNLKELSFDISANGFEFIFYKLRKPTIEINVDSYYKENQKNVILSKEELTKLISIQLDKDVVKNPSVDKLQINLDGIISKKIPVKGNIKFSYKNGFRPIDSLKFKPDSVTISGPSKFIDTINFISTKQVSENEIDTSFSISTGLALFKNKKVTVSPKEVEVSIKVEEFSQKEMTLNIMTVNVPPNITIKLIPKVVTISFNVSISDFQNITKNDFTLVCNYDERNKDENFMTPKLVKQPKGVFDIEFDTKKIDYLIFK
jgi:hypothetical protein